MLKQSVREIAPFTWCVSEFGLVNAFAAAGNERAAVIDTGCGYGNIREIAEEITSRPLIVILTHKHPDHAGGIFHFRDCPVYMNGLDKDLVFPGMGFDNAFRKMYLDTRGPLRCPDVMKDVYSLIPESEPDMTFSFTHAEDGMRIDLGGRVLEVIHTPGHTPGGICLVGEGVVMSGDSLFAGSIGRTDFPTGSMTDLISNLKAKILTLDENLTVFPGHGGATTIAYEKQINPYLG